MRAFLVALLIWSVSADAKDLLVNKTDPSSFKSIQEAVNAAEPGDIIKIYPGVYRETVSITKNGITLEAAKEKGEAILDGSDPAFAKNARWIHVKGRIYKTKYKWPHRQPTDEEFTRYGGGSGIGHIPMQVYEDGIILRGYRNKRDERFFEGHKLKKMGDGGVIAGAYSELEQLDPQKSRGRLPKDWIKKDIRVPGRFMYDEKNGELYIWSAKEDDPANHKYEIPALINLIKINAKNVKVKNITVKNSAGRAIEVKNSSGVAIEDCFLINNRYPVRVEASRDLTIRGCFIQERGLWERYWYDDMKTTIMHGAAISLNKADNVKIFDNTIAGCYAGVRTKGQNIKIYNNIISYCVSTGINATDVKVGSVPSDFKYNLQVFNNIIHHVDLNGAIAVSFVAYGPIWFYRNIVYCSAFLSKNGAMKQENALGKTYFYNNTVALIKNIITHPYIYPCGKSDVYANNIFYVKYIRWENYYAYHKKTWEFFPFKNGPVLDYNIYWMPLPEKPKDEDLRIAFIGLKDKKGKSYKRDEFDQMRKDMDIEPHGFQAEPGFKNSEALEHADVKTFKIDELSLMNYKDVRAKKYAKVFKKTFYDLYNFFAIKKDSPAIKKGMKLPDDWPQLGITKDAHPDIGAYEFGADNGVFYDADAEKKNNSGIFSFLGL